MATASREARPSVFTVGVNIDNHRGGGHLRIDRGTITLEPGPLVSRTTGASRIVQTEPEVTVIRARLGLPWMNTSVVVKSADAVGIATTWFGARRRLLSALTSGGFVTHDTSTWISPGELWRYTR